VSPSALLPLAHLALAVNHEQQPPVLCQIEEETEKGTDDIDRELERVREEERRGYEEKLAALRLQSNIEMQAAVHHQKELLAEEHERKVRELRDQYEISARAPDLPAILPTEAEEKTARIQNRNMRELIALVEEEFPRDLSVELKWGVLETSDHIRTDTLRSSKDCDLKITKLEGEIQSKKRKIALIAEDVIELQKTIQTSIHARRRIAKVEEWRKATAPIRPIVDGPREDDERPARKRRRLQLVE
jgi:hypothetical protein